MMMNEVGVMNHGGLNPTLFIHQIYAMQKSTLLKNQFKII